MSRNVDEQVVKLTFDNKDFEGKANKSATTLGRVKDAAADLTSTLGNGLSSALQRLNFTDLLKVGGLAGGLTLLKNGINELEAPIKRVSDMATNAIENTLKSAMNQIKNGGWSRAQKIDNAKFMLKGLGLDEKTFMEAADWAVSGTAYTLDAAANAASQFGASGYKDLEQLKYMLRSISGVAAMTNRDFEEISYLWTQMAGLGRVTGMTLTSLSMKGINAAKTLGDAIGKTETEVREMVSKGQIDFDTFAKAMDDAFGQHAKDANDTFSGATANIRAALSKLGADFFSIILSSKNFNTALNAVRETLNMIRDVTKPIAEGPWINVFETFAMDFLELVHEAQELLNGGDFFKGLTLLQEFNKVFEWLLDKANKLLYVIDHIIGFNDNMYFARIGNAIALVTEQVRVLVDEIIGVFDRSFDWFKVAESFRGRVVSFIQDIANGFKFSGTQISNIRYFISQIIKLGKRLGSTFANVFNINKFRPVDVVKAFVNQLTKLISKLTLSDKAIEGINKAAKGLFDVVKLIYDAASSVVTFLWPIVLDIIPGLLDGIAQISGWIGTLASNTVDFLENSDAMKAVWEQIRTVIQNIVDIAGRIGTSFFNLFFGGEGGSGKTFFKRVEEFGTELGNIINDAAKSLDLDVIDFGPLKDFFNNLFNLGFTTDTELENKLDKSINLTNIVETVIGIFSTVIDKVKGFFNQLYEMAFVNTGHTSLLGKPIYDMIESFNEATRGVNAHRLDVMRDIFMKIGDILLTLIATIGAIAVSKNFEGIFKNFGESLSNNVNEIVKSIKAISEALGSGAVNKSMKGVESAEKVLNAGNIVNFMEAVAKTVLAVAGLILVVKILDVKASDVGLIAGILGATMGIITVCISVLAFISSKLSSRKTTAFRFNGKGGDGGKYKQLRLTDKLANGAGNTVASIMDFAHSAEEGPFGDISKALLVIAGGVFLISASIAVLRFGMGGYGGIEKTKEAAKMIMLVVGGLTVLLTAISLLGSFIQGKGDLIGDFETKMLAVAGSLALAGVAMTLIAASLIALTFVDQDKVLTAATIMGVLVGALMIIFGLIGALVVDPKASIIIGVSGLSILAAFAGAALLIFNIATAVAIIATLDSNKIDKARKTMVTLASVILGISAGIALIIGIIAAINPAAGAIAAVGLVALGFDILEIGAAILVTALAFKVAADAGASLVKSMNNFLIAMQQLYKFFSDESIDSSTIRTFKKNFSEFAAALIDGWFEGLRTSVALIKVRFPEYIDDIADIIKDALFVFPKIIRSLFTKDEQGESLFSLLMDILIPNRAHSVAEFLDRLQPLWSDTIKPALDSWVDLMSPAINDIVRRICDYVVEFSVVNAPIIAASAVETFTIWVTSFDEALTKNKDQLETVLRNLFGTMGEIAIDVLVGEEMWDKFKSIGDNIAAGIGKGLQNAVNGKSFLEVLWGVGTTIYNNICASLDINSPSKVMEKVGDFVVQGLGLGIENGKGGLNTTLDGLVESFTGFGDNISGIFDKFDFKITPELDTSLIDGGLSGLKDTIGNFDMTNIGSIMNTRDKMNAMPNVNDLLDATNAKMSDILGTVYSIDQSKLNTQPINIDVALEGDTGKFFKAMVKENHRYTLANGASAF